MTRKLFLFLFFLSQAFSAIRCRECEGKLYLRSRAVIKQFQRETGFPKGRKGWIVDHVVPLACASELQLRRRDLDVIENLQWQSKAEAQSKDRWERNHCQELRRDPRFVPKGVE